MGEQLLPRRGFGVVVPVVEEDVVAVRKSARFQAAAQLCGFRAGMDAYGRKIAPERAFHLLAAACGQRAADIGTTARQLDGARAGPAAARALNQVRARGDARVAQAFGTAR